METAIKQSPGGEPGLRINDGTTLFSLPHSEESEQCILGGILQNPELVEKAVNKLNHNDFYDSRHGLIFMACEELYKKGVAVDEVMIFEFLRQRGLVDKVPVSYLGALRDAFTSEVTFDFHLSRIRQAADARKELELFERLRQAYNNGAGKSAIKEYRNQLVKLWDGGNGSTIKLKPISAKDLPKVEPIESLWGEIFYPGAITQINSEPGVGKTTLLYNLCVYGAMGKDFLGVPFPRQLKSFMLDLETPGWLRRAKLERILGDVDLPDGFHFLDDIDLRADFPDLLSLCKQQRYDLVIFDTQSRVLAMEQENDNAEANYLLGLMRRLVNETNCSLALVHHAGKVDTPRSVYKGRGASAIAGGVDIITNIETLDETTLKLTVAKNRIVGTNPILHFKKAGEDLFQPYTPPGENSGFELFEAQKFILALAPNRDWSTGEVCEAGEREGFSRSTIERALKRLYEAGKLGKPKRGIYRFRQTVNPIYADGIDGKGENDDFPEYL